MLLVCSFCRETIAHMAPAYQAEKRPAMCICKTCTTEANMYYARANREKNLREVGSDE